MITLERLKELLAYDPETGIFTHRLNRQGHGKAGDQAGTIDKNGYRNIKLDGRKYAGSRLAFFYFYGRWPDPEVDHKDHDTLNDRIENLREATRRQNSIHTRRSRRRVPEYRGVAPANSKWMARIGVAGITQYLGIFDTKEEAAMAYDKAAKQIGAEFSILNFPDA